MLLFLPAAAGLRTVRVVVVVVVLLVVVLVVVVKEFKKSHF